MLLNLRCVTRLVQLVITSYTARATRYTARYTSAVTWPKKRSLEKMVSLDLSLQRHLTGPLESSLQDFFRSLVQHHFDKFQAQIAVFPCPCLRSSTQIQNHKFCSILSETKCCSRSSTPNLVALTHQHEFVMVTGTPSTNISSNVGLKRGP